MRLHLSLLSLVFALLVGCGNPSPRPATTASNVTSTPTTGSTTANADNSTDEERPLYFSHAQTNLSVIRLLVGTEPLKTELCLTAQQMATGMMYRTNLDEDAAMLFPFTSPQRVSFYMRNTTVPLSAAYLDATGVIIEVHDLKPLDETPVPSTASNIQYVLEVKQGWFQRHQMGPGVLVQATHGSLHKQFFGR